MSKYKGNTKSVVLSLPYFKQGDDMHNCLTHFPDGKLNAKQSIQNHISLLQDAIDVLNQINSIIPVNNNIDIEADCHVIILHGNNHIMDTLIAEELVKEDSSYEDDEDTDEICGSDVEEMGKLGINNHSDEIGESDIEEVQKNLIINSHSNELCGSDTEEVQKNLEKIYNNNDSDVESEIDEIQKVSDNNSDIESEINEKQEDAKLLNNDDSNNGEQIENDEIFEMDKIEDSK
jgi:hypothetical protein